MDHITPAVTSLWCLLAITVCLSCVWWSHQREDSGQVLRVMLELAWCISQDCIWGLWGWGGGPHSRAQSLGSFAYENGTRWMFPFCCFPSLFCMSLWTHAFSLSMDYKLVLLCIDLLLCASLKSIFKKRAVLSFWALDYPTYSNLVPLPQPWHSSFSKQLWLLLFGNGVRTHGPAAGHAY